MHCLYDSQCDATFMEIIIDYLKRFDKFTYSPPLIPCHLFTLEVQMTFNQLIQKKMKFHRIIKEN